MNGGEDRRETRRANKRGEVKSTRSEVEINEERRDQ